MNKQDKNNKPLVKYAEILLSSPFAVAFLKPLTFDNGGQDFQIVDYNDLFKKTFQLDAAREKEIFFGGLTHNVSPADLFKTLTEDTNSGNSCKGEFSFNQSSYHFAAWQVDEACYALQILSPADFACFDQETASLLEKYQLAESGSKEGIWDWKITEDSLYLSPAWKEMIGYKDNELENRFSTFQDRVHPDDIDRVMQYVDDYLHGKIKVYHQEFRFRHKNGSYIWILAKGEAIRDKKGIPVRMAGIHSDITERKQIEESLAEERRLRDKILGLTGTGINIVDLDYNVVDVDSLWQRTLADHPGTTKCYKLFMNLNSPCSDCGIQQSVETGEAVITTRKYPDGRVLEIHTLPIKDNSGRQLIANFALDISARRKQEAELLNINRHLREAIQYANELADKAEMANVAKTQFLANVSHEIRTPMNGIIGMTGLLLETKLDSEQKMFAELVNKSAADLMVIIDDILDLSKIESDKVEPEILEFDLCETVDSAVDVLAFKAHEKNLDFCLRMDPALDGKFKGDPGRIRQIILNLGGNAVKFTDKGYVSIIVHKTQENSEKTLVRFEVSDSGIGIPEGKHELLFTPFQQLDPSMTRKFGGTGLGLALAKRLVELLGGEIGFSSRTGHGSSFWFTVFLDNMEETRKVPDSRFKGLKILSVNSSENEQAALREIFAYHEIIGEFSSNYKEISERIVMAAIARSPFHMILLGHKIKDMTGLEVGKKLFEANLLEKPPVVLLNPIGMRMAEEELTLAGIAGEIKTPLKNSSILAVLERHVLARTGDKKKTNRVEREDFLTAEEKSGIRILLVEDDFTNQRVILGLLAQLGFKADLAEDGTAALTKVAENRYDLIFMDIQIPGIDGLDVTRKIRQNADFATHKEVLIIAVTAYALSGDRQRCIDSGMNDYIAKPIKADQIWNMLKKWLEKKA